MERKDGEKEGSEGGRQGGRKGGVGQIKTDKGIEIEVGRGQLSCVSCIKPCRHDCMF